MQTSPVARVIISISAMLFAGFAMTRITKRLRLPNVTGYILAGILMGPCCFNLIPQEIISGTAFLSDIALAFIAFSAGEFFKIDVLKRNGAKVIVITVLEACLASVAVFALVYGVLHLELSFSIVLAALAGLATLYVNGKLDLLHYNDGSVDSMGTIDADEDQDLDGSGLVHSDDEMAMPEGSPFADDDVLNILLIGTDERTEAVNDADAFTHLNQLDGTKDTTEFSEDARADSLILVSLDIKDHAIRLVSIERGLGVPILLDGSEGECAWITDSFR